MAADSIVQTIIEQNKMFAPNRAKVILIHEDGRVVFAEKFEQGCAFWWGDTLRESKLQGVIHKLSLVAKRNDNGEWVPASKILEKHVPPKPMSRQDRILAHQETLKKARSGSTGEVDKSKSHTGSKNPSVAPATKEDVKVDIIKPRTGGDLKVDSTSTSVIKSDPVVEAIVEPEKSFNLDDFICIRDLEAPRNRRAPDELFVSFRSNGKMIFCKALREQLPWPGLNMLVSKDFKQFAIMQGKVYNVNQSGTYINRALASKLSFPEDSGTVRVIMEWNEKLNAFTGTIC